jgi:hypothetical protein
MVLEEDIFILTCVVAGNLKNNGKIKSREVITWRVKKKHYNNHSQDTGGLKILAQRSWFRGSGFEVHEVALVEVLGHETDEEVEGCHLLLSPGILAVLPVRP